MTLSNVLPRVIQGFTHNAVGEEVRRQYKLLKKIGDGGMGVVFKAIDLDPPSWYREIHGDQPRFVVIKFLKDPTEDERNAARFCREAKLANMVDHPNVARVHGLCIDEEEKLFLVMDYEENARTLAEVLESSKSRALRNPATGKMRESVVPLSLFCVVIRQLLDAVDAVHAKSIIHRDLKPDNVLLVGSSDEPSVRLIDFGIAKSMDVALESMNVTQKNVIPGTPMYMSPEQLSQVYQKVDDQTVLWSPGPRSDVWALGVIMYELITDHCPFFEERRVMNRDGIVGLEPDYGAICSQVSDLSKPCPPMSDFVETIPETLVMLVEACLQKEPWERFDCAQIRVLLQNVEDEVRMMKRQADAETRPVPVMTPQSQPIPPAKRSRLRVVAVSAALLTAASYLGWMTCGPYPVKPTVLVAGAIHSGSDATPLASVVPPPAPAVSSENMSVVVAKRVPEPAQAEPGMMSQDLARAEAFLKARQCRAAERKAHFLLAKHPAFPPPFRILAECALLRTPQNTKEARSNADRYLGFEGTSPQDFSPALRQFLEISPSP